MKQHIQSLLSEALPAVDFESDFLFSELDSIGVSTIIILLSQEYNIELTHTDMTPKNLRSLDAIVKMVESKLNK